MEIKRYLQTAVLTSALLGVSAVDLGTAQASGTDSSVSESAALVSLRSGGIFNLDQFQAAYSNELNADLDNLANHPEMFSRVDLDAYKMYGPMYKAGEIEYQIPRSLLFIIHGKETTYSLSKDTYSSLYSGAMQRSNDKGIAVVNEAAKNWAFLSVLPQHYPDDWKEIIWAAKYIRDDANSIRARYSSDEEAIMNALYGYSAVGPANERIARYRAIKGFFTPSSPTA